MRFTALLLATAACACSNNAPGSDQGDNGGPGSAGSNAPLSLPRVYPPVRANTPNALIGDAQFMPAATSVTHQAQMAMGPGGMMGMPEPSLGTVVQQRLYTPGPTELLRIVHDLDDRVAGLDPRPAKHPCLTTAPVAHSYSLPGGETFTVHLQCLVSFGGAGGWIAFGYGAALPSPPDAGGNDDGGIDKDAESERGPPDGGALGAEGGGNDFYLITGQATGNGGAYRIDRRSGDVEGWVAVADSALTRNSQVLMHILSLHAPGTLEMTFAGQGVGFCAAHLKTGHDFLFIDGKSLVPPPEGMMYEACGTSRAACFDAAHLDRDLGARDPGCAGLASGSFQLPVSLDASPGGNVSPPSLASIFSSVPAGIPAF
jgi:hypothetical protein